MGFGVILVPDSLLEFIAEMGYLIEELNFLLGQETHPEEVRGLLSGFSQVTFDGLPHRIQQQLLLERDPHGNLPVSQIQTERLLIELVTLELDQRKEKRLYSGKFKAVGHFFGYEGRCALPTNFDCNYGSALGKTACILLQQKATGSMAAVSDLHLPVSQWKPCGFPLVRMMNLERRSGVIKPTLR